MHLGSEFVCASPKKAINDLPIERVVDRACGPVRRGTREYLLRPQSQRQIVYLGSVRLRGCTIGCCMPGENELCSPTSEGMSPGADVEHAEKYSLDEIDRIGLLVHFSLVTLVCLGLEKNYLHKA